MGLGTIDGSIRNGWHGDAPDKAELWYEGVLRAQVIQIGRFFVGKIFSFDDTGTWAPTIELTPKDTSLEGYEIAKTARSACELVTKIGPDQF